MAAAGLLPRPEAVQHLVQQGRPSVRLAGQHQRPHKGPVRTPGARARPKGRGHGCAHHQGCGWGGAEGKETELLRHGGKFDIRRSPCAEARRAVRCHGEGEQGLVPRHLHDEGLNLDFSR